MTRKDKLLRRFQDRPRDFTWDELVRLLTALGFKEARTGKTGGSRRRFIHGNGLVIMLHKPHPGNVVKAYVMDDVRNRLMDGGLI